MYHYCLVVRGHHVYKTIWNAFVGEVSVYEQETQMMVAAGAAFIRGWHLLS